VSSECDREAPYGEVMTRNCVEVPRERKEREERKRRNVEGVECFRIFFFLSFAEHLQRVA